MGGEPPVLDGRSSAEIHDDTVSLVPSYVDRFAPASDPTGDAMLTLFAEMAAVVASDLDALPEKHFVSFLDRLGFDRRPPQRARLPLTVTVADGAGRNVVVRAGTRVLAAGADGTEQTFEVTPGAAFEATPANLVAVYATDPARDHIHDVLTPLQAGESTPLFGGDNAQAHHLYVGHGDLLTLDGGSRLLVELRTSASRAVFAQAATWEFFGTTAADDTETWRPLSVVGESRADATDARVRTTDARTRADASASAHRPVSVLLELPAGAVSVAHEVDGIETMWVRATHPSGNTAATGAFLSGIRLASGPSLQTLTPVDEFVEAEATLLVPDAMFHNDVELVVEDGQRVYPFGETPQQRDVFAISSSEAFSKPGATVTLTFAGATALFDDERRLSWEYYNGEGWRRLSSAAESDSLSFDVPPDLTETAVVGGKSHWIRARLLDTEFGQVTYRRVPFEEFFSGTGAENQTLEVETPPIDEVSIFVAESTNGDTTWVEWTEVSDLGDSGDEDTHFEVDEGGGSITFGDGDHGKVLPAGTDNVKATYRGGTYDWKLDGEAIPSFDRLDIEYGNDAVDVELPPTVTTTGDLRLHVLAPEHVVTYNNRAYETHDSPEHEDALEPFEPFAGLADETQAVYLGFDAPLTDGPVQVFCSVAEQLFPEAFDTRIRWEYPVDEAGSTWETATVEDGTAGLTERGIVALSFDSPTASTGRFGAENHWVRAAIVGTPFEYDDGDTEGAADTGASTEPLVESEPETADTSPTDGLVACESVVSTRPPLEAPSATPPTVLGITPNTGWASNVRSVAAETLGSSDGTPNQTFTLRSTPATDVRVEVDELATLTTDERAALVEAGEEVVEQIDENGDLTAFWVRWSVVADVDDATVGDRRCTVAWSTGEITFGDGIDGRIPAVGNAVRASYETGGGLSGNVAAGSVERLVSSIAFVESVTNVEAADGGVDAETTAQVRTRAPTELRDRNRAVTLADVERLAMAASRRLARVKALGAMDGEGAYAPGAVTLVVVPQSEAIRPTPSVELRRRVLDGVQAHAPATLSSPADRLVVRGPRFVSASVSASLVSRAGASRSLLEAAASAAVTAYLHPLTGGDDGTGWGFGDLPCLSDLFALLEGVADVDHVDRLALTFAGDEGGTPLTVTPGDDEPSVAVDALVYSGDHDISVTGAV